MCFTNPVAQVAKILPPPRSDIQQVLAIVFIGNGERIEDDIDLLEKKSPFVVRHASVRGAIIWLQANNPFYHDVVLSEHNLSQFKDGRVGVDVSFTSEDAGRKDGLDPPVTKNGPEDEFGEDFCPFSVSGVSEIDLRTMSYTEKKVLALKHLKGGGEALAISGGSAMLSQYDNPSLWAGTFPWLFPYGLGLPESKRPVKLSLEKHADILMRYPDKRFQVCYHEIPFAKLIRFIRRITISCILYLVFYNVAR